MEIRCKHCGSFSIVKRGLRKLKRNKKQVYSCKDCGRRFSLDVSKKRFQY